MTHSINEFEKTRLAPYLRSSMVETEHRLAKVHVIIGVLGCAVSVYLVLQDMLPLIMPGWLYLSGLFLFLVYATVYYIWAPYRTHSPYLTAGIITFLDLLVATLIILNTGGLESTFWGLWAAVALTYIIRFRFGWTEGIILVLLLAGTIILGATLVGQFSLPAHGAIVGTAFSLLAVLSGGYALVGREREAIRKGIDAENQAIQRIVNTVQHEVNNPLTIANGNLSLLKDHATEASFRAKLDKIEDALKRIGAAVEQLKELEAGSPVAGVGTIERYPLSEQAEIREGEVSEDQP